MAKKSPFDEPPLKPLPVEELKKLGRKKMIELAVEAARDAGSTMIPKDFKDVKVLVGEKDVLVILAKGLRAYTTDSNARRIESLAVQVRFNDSGPCISYEGDDLMTDADEKVLKLVLRKIPPNYTYERITIIDNPAEDPKSYLVELEGEHTMGRHNVDRKTGEWTYVTHKHFACGHGMEERGYDEMMD
jgi:hypothetical protein